MKSSNTAVGIFGFGEVGKAIAEFYASPKIKDRSRDDGLIGIDILHVCIPYSEGFVEIVKKQIAASRPKLTIIHSTVAPGTTKTIGGRTVHSPIRGRHPHLYESQKIFVKFIGADDMTAGKMAEDHLKSLGMKTALVSPSVSTELAKLFDTTYYGLCIAFHGEMAKACKKFGADFETVATAFNRTYNEGYTAMGLPNVVRPVLTPPENGIGGHCVIPNAKILKQFMESPVLDLILAYQPADHAT